MEKLYNIIRNAGMSTRPEYYSGRGATLSDLNGKMLTKILDNIKKEFGDKAGKNFIKMVADIKVLSATTFLQELYTLFNNDWKYMKKKRHALGVAISKDENGNHSVAQGMASIFSAMSAGDIDHTRDIRDSFLLSNGVHVEYPENVHGMVDRQNYSRHGKKRW